MTLRDKNIINLEGDELQNTQVSIRFCKSWIWTVYLPMYKTYNLHTVLSLTRNLLFKVGLWPLTYLTWVADPGLICQGHCRRVKLMTWMTENLHRHLSVMFIPITRRLLETLKCLLVWFWGPNTFFRQQWWWNEWELAGMFTHVHVPFNWFLP